jgi:hypothetical protein
VNSRFLKASKAVRKGLTEKPGRRAQARKRQHRLLFEALEDRRLLAVSPSLLQTIEGFNIDDNAFNNNFAVVQPPDPHGAVGPNHILNVGNQSIQWFTKAGVQHMQTSLKNFFAPLRPDYGVFDPKAVYDQHSNRYVVIALEAYLRSSGDFYDMSRIMVAVSDDADPNGTWYYHSINSMVNVPDPTNPGVLIRSWTDYPGLGLDKDALYVTGSLFDVDDLEPQGSRLWIVDKGLGKGGLYDNGPAAVTMWDAARLAGVDFSGNYTGGTPEFRSMQPAHVFGTAPAGVGTWLVMYDGMNNGVQEFVDVVRVSNPLTQPTFRHFSVNVGDIEDSSIVPIDYASPQRGTVAPIDGGDRRITSVVWRNNSLYATTVIYPTSGPDTNQVTTHWFRFNTSNADMLPLADQGNIGGEELGFAAHTIWPAVNVDTYGNMVVSFSATGPTLYPGSYYAVRTPTDPAGTVRMAGTLAAGQDVFALGGNTATSQNRWGDYTSVALDPTDGVTFWLYNMYALPRLTTNGRWGTRWGSLQIAAPTPPPPPGPVTISGVVWHDQDENRRRDLIEPGLRDWTVYVDLDGDGERDLGEPAVKTDSAGRYSITVDIPTNGTLIVRQAVKPGWQQTFPVQPSLAHVLTLTGGGTIADVNFGNSDNAGFDWGDAPAPYPTLKSANGPRHAILPGFGLGVNLNDGLTALVDGEPDGIPHPNALGDDLDNFDDENGVVFTTGMTPGRTAIITVTVSTGSNAPGMLQGWIDFNRNGSWADSGEQVFKNLTLGAGVHTLEVNVPSTAIPGTTFARFRYGYEKDLSYVGSSFAGEVEDYRADILTDRPVAVDDRFEVEQDSRDNVFRVLANDIPSSSGIANVRIRDPLNTAGASGTAVIDRNGTPNDFTDDFIRYTPARGAFAPDAFSYTIEDIVTGSTSTATVYVTIIQAGGLVPIAVDDSYLVPPPTVPVALLDVPTDPFLFNVLKNDRVGPTGAISIPTNGLDSSSTIGSVALELRTVNNQPVQMVRYTPASNFSGTDQFRYTIVDSFGSTSTATVTVQVGVDRRTDDVVRYRLVTADMNGNPISEIGQGMPFQVLTYVQDVRNELGYAQVPNFPPNNRGVYSAYMDLLYDAGLVSFASVQFSPDYSEGQFVDPRVPGILDEIGAFQGNGSNNNNGNPYGPSERLLYSAVFTASALGTARFKSDPADVLPLHETALNVPPNSVGYAQVDYGATTINVIDSPDLVQVRLEATTLQGTPLPNNQIAAGTEFYVKAWVDDIRTTIAPNQQGVFSAYLDIIYNSTLARPVTVPTNVNPLGFDITAGALFQGGLLKGINRSTVGIVDEVGTFQGLVAQTFSNEQLLFQIRFVAQGGGSGTLVFTADPADNLPLNETTLIKPDPGVSVPPAQIRYVSTAPIIVLGGSGEGEFTNPYNRFDVNNDGFVTPMDALALINILNLSGPVDLSGLVPGGEGEARGPYYDVNGDLYISPMDVLAVINAINSETVPSGAEGEAPLPAPLNLTQQVAGLGTSNDLVAWAVFESPESPIAIGAESANRSDPGWWAPEEDDEDSLADANRQMDAFAVDSAFEQLLDDDLAGDIATAWGQELGAQGLLAALV